MASVKKILIKGFGGLEYLSVEVLMRDSKYGDVMVGDLRTLEHLVAREIIRKGVPIRGKEIRFLRRALGLTLAEFGRHFDISPTAVLKWEAKADVRLSPPNEVSVKLMVAEQLKFVLQGKFSQLRGERIPGEKPRLILIKGAGVGSKRTSSPKVANG